MLDTPTQDRLYASMVERDCGHATPCWVWIGRLNHDGYAIFDVDRKPKRAVRVVYELVVGPIPDGLTLDHLCRNRACVRPLHVEPVTNRVNVLRGEGPTAVRARATECKRGHPLSGDNLRVDKRGYRSCRRCRTDWQNEADRRSGSRRSLPGRHPRFRHGAQPRLDVPSAGRPRGAVRAVLLSPRSAALPGRHPRFRHGARPVKRLIAWPTPTARDHKDGQYNPNVPINGLLGRAVWGTPRAADGMSHPLRSPENIEGDGRGRLEDQVALAEGSPTGGALNPTWVEWLMGFPLGWTDLGPSATRSSRRSSSGSAAASSKRTRK